MAVHPPAALVVVVAVAFDAWASHELQIVVAGVTDAGPVAPWAAPKEQYRVNQRWSVENNILIKIILIQHSYDKLLFSSML